MTVLLGLTTRLRLSRLAYVTSTHGGGRDFAQHCAALYSAGVDLLIVRESGLADEALAAALDIARDVAQQRNKLACASGSIAVAKAHSADVLLVPSSVESATAKAALHQYALLGRAAHDASQIESAVADPAIAFLTVGPVRVAADSPFEAPGLELVADAARQIPIASPQSQPWFATGVGLDNLDDVLRAGGRRVVLVEDGSDPVATVSKAEAALKSAWDGDPALADYAFAVFGVNL